MEPVKPIEKLFSEISVGDGIFLYQYKEKNENPPQDEISEPVYLGYIMNINYLNNSMTLGRNSMSKAPKLMQILKKQDENYVLWPIPFEIGLPKKLSSYQRVTKAR